MAMATPNRCMCCSGQVGHQSLCQKHENFSVQHSRNSRGADAQSTASDACKVLQETDLVERLKWHSYGFSVGKDPRGHPSSGVDKAKLLDRLDTYPDFGPARRQFQHPHEAVTLGFEKLPESGFKVKPQTGALCSSKEGPTALTSILCISIKTAWLGGAYRAFRRRRFAYLRPYHTQPKSNAKQHCAAHCP